MIAPEASTIIDELNRRLSLPLREGERRRLIFWHDAEEAFRNNLPEVAAALNNAILVERQGGNSFRLKKLLCSDDKESNYVVYCPEVIAESDNWLLALELSSERVSFDLVSLWIREMELNDSKAIRDMIHRYSEFFRKKDYRMGIKSMGEVIASQIPLCAACVICKLKKPEPHGLISAILQAGLEPQDNAILQELKRCDLADVVMDFLRSTVDYHNQQLHPGLLAMHVILAATSHAMGNDCLDGLEEYFSEVQREQCYSIVHEWQEAKSERAQEYFDRLVSYVEEETGMSERIKDMPLDMLAGMKFFPQVDVCLLVRMMQIIDKGGNMQGELLRRLAGQRRTSPWYAKREAYYEALDLASRIFDFNYNHSKGFCRTAAGTLWKEYMEDYHRMDMWYRQFCVYANKVKDCYDEVLHDPFIHVIELVENIYSNWYLTELGEAWYHSSCEDLASSGAIDGVEKQYFFYDNRVAPETNKVWVIISDALRYEVAAELKDKLASAVTGKLQLESCQAIFPTLTRFGMAALLPHKQLQLRHNERGDISVLIDGKSAESQNRENILASTKKENSLTLTVNEFLHMKKDERRKRVKGMDVVYLYHDQIDAAGHQDSGVFEACEKAIAQLVNVVRILDGEQRVKRVLITADHGFLYTSRPLQEADKVSLSAAKGHIVEMGRRHVITSGNVELPHMQKVKLNYDAGELEAWSPIGKVRLAKQGGGSLFVHGGASLQEMMVPILDIRMVRSGTKDYENNRDSYETSPVKLQCISEGSNTIRNRSFHIRLVQDEPIGLRKKAVTYKVYFEDEKHVCISDVHTIIADRSAPERRDRVFNEKFTLKNGDYDKQGIYYLVVSDTSNKQLPLRIVYSIDLAQYFESNDWF